jgi:proteasome lid subunit RPN8/RPN11
MDQMRGREKDTWLIGAEVCNYIIRHAVKDYPKEACGILFGTGDNAAWVQEAQAVTNITTQDRCKRYLVDPLEMLQADRSAEEKGFIILGFYHSHPDQSAYPSEFDRGLAWTDYLYLIIAVRKGAFHQAKAWMLDPGKEDFREVKVGCGPGAVLC